MIPAEIARNQPESRFVIICLPSICGSRLEFAMWGSGAESWQNAIAGYFLCRELSHDSLNLF
jgi:hypothetical protein